MNSKKVKLAGKEWISISIQMILVGIVILVGFLWKSPSEIPIASDTDAVIEMTADQNILIQSWQATSKNIIGFSIPVDRTASNHLTGSLSISLKEDADAKENVCQGIIELSAVDAGEEAKAVFQKAKLELGKRYYFVLELTGVEKDTSLVLRTNSEYGGMILGGKEISGAVAGDIEFERTNNIAWLIRILVVFGAIAGLFMAIFDRRFEETIALSFGCVFLYLYIWGVFERLEWGVISLCILSALIALALPYLLKVKKRRISDMISPGMIAFFVLFFVYFILDRNVVAGKVDDLNHWQLCVRDMWYFNSYPFHPGSTVFVMRYTPGFATIEYLFTYLYGAYREGIVMLACHAIGFAMLSILCTKITWKSCHKVLPVTVLIAGLPLLIYQSHYGILYVDAYLGIMGAYMLICYFTEEFSAFQTIRIGTASVFLAMTKEMGLAIAGTVYVIIFMDLCLKNRKLKNLIRDKRLWSYVKSGCLTLLTFLSWQIYIAVVGRKYGFTDSFNNILSLFGIAKANVPVENKVIEIASLTDSGVLQEVALQAEEAAQIANATPVQTVKDMLHWLLFEREFFNQSYLGITIIILLLCAAVGLGGVYKKLNIPIKRVVTGLLLGTGIYAAFLVVCYIFLFSEASSIPAARRYMGSYLLLFMITLCGILIVKSNEADAGGLWKQQLTWITALFILLNIPADHHFYTTEENFGEYFSTWKNHQTIGEVFNSFADKSEKIYFVEYKNSELVPQYDYLTFANAVVPNQTQGLWGGWKPVVSESERYKQYTVQYDEGEWARLLEDQYTYVYLRYVDDYFIDNYGNLFENTDDIVTGNIFRICKNGGEISLRKIAYKNLE